MLVKLVLVVAVVVAALVAAQRMDLVHEWGVVGSCEPVRAPVDDGSHWYACSEGLLTGHPSLIGDECTYEERGGGYEFWTCPEPLPRYSDSS